MSESVKQKLNFWQLTNAARIIQAKFTKIKYLFQADSFSMAAFVWYLQQYARTDLNKRFLLDQRLTA